MPLATQVEKNESEAVDEKKRPSNGEKSGQGGNKPQGKKKKKGPKRKVEVLPGGGDWAASFQFVKEDHTLGNLLRYVIMKNPDVEFCGYTMPHPSEEKMNLRIQTYKGSMTAHEALKKGINDLSGLCDVLEETFTTARDDFNANKMQ